MFLVNISPKIIWGLSDKSGRDNKCKVMRAYSCINDGLILLIYVYLPCD